MALSQTQIIQSLAEALNWLEKELSWDVSPATLGHLTGRIGELYAAMITRGQMALSTNQHGYDVVSAENERISVKTITSSSNVAFNANTFAHVDRIMILRVNINDDAGISVETLLDCSAEEARSKLRLWGSKYLYRVARGRARKPLENMLLANSLLYREFTIQQFENGTIRLINDETIEPVSKPILRRIAAEIGVDIQNGSGGMKNTRQLGSDIIRTLRARQMLDSSAIAG